jgi:signal transduction histidine kinase
MLLPANWLARWLGYGWLGVLTFGISPPPGRNALITQAACYAVAAVAMAGWLLADYQPSVARHRDRVVPVCLGVMAVTMGLAATTGNGGTFLVIYGAIATLAASGDTGLTTALAVTAAGILATEIGGLAGDGGLATLLGLPAVLAGGFMVGRNRAAYRIQAEQAAVLLAQRDRLQAEQRRADLLDERARIAREIHDVLAHSLGALGIQIQAARSVLTDRGDIAMASDLLAAAQRMAAEGLVETRRAINALRAGTLPLDEELAKVTSTYGERYRVTVGMGTDGTPRPVPADATVALLRVAQEALVNAAKHAAGQPVTLRLEFGATDIKLTVRNDLPPGGDGRAAREGGATAEDGAVHPGAAGADVRTANAGYGLTSMRERLRMQDGTLDAGPAGGQWAVTARLPLPGRALPGRALPGRALPERALPRESAAPGKP